MFRVVGERKIIDWSLLHLTHPSQMDKSFFSPHLQLVAVVAVVSAVAAVAAVVVVSAASGFLF